MFPPPRFARALHLALPLLLAAVTAACSDSSGSPNATSSGSFTSMADVSGTNATPQSATDNASKGGSGSGADVGQGPADASVMDAAAKAPGAADAQAAMDTSNPSDSSEPQDDAGAGACNQTDPVVLYLSADDSNSMASATVARGLIQQGQYAYKPVRAYELLNYYDFAYPAALPDHVSPTAQLRPVDPAKGTFRLQIGVRAPDVTEAARRRFNVVLTIDTSASMGWGPAGDTGLDRARAACLGLVAALDKGDTVSLLTWGGTVQVLADGVVMSGKDDGTLAKACNGLKPDGDSPLSAGLAKAYALAQQHFAADRINRVILISDGGANVGEQDAKLIAQMAKGADGKGNGEGIYLMGAGVGDPWNYNDQLMNTVTDAGKGAYVFLDSQTEAQDLFAKALLRHLEVAARNVQVQVTLPPTFGIQTFYGEQVSTKKEEVEPQHLAANDAMVFHQVIQSCAPKSLTGDEIVQVVATWEHPVTHQPMQDSWSAKWKDLLAGDAQLLRKGEAIVAYSDALNQVQSLDGKAAQAAIDQALATVANVQAELGGDPDLQQIADLLKTYRATFQSGQAPMWQTAGKGGAALGGTCGCQGSAPGLAAMACALDLCDPGVLLDQAVTSPSASKTEGAFAAVPRFGSAGNELTPKVGGTYALLATGPATGSAHSVDLGGNVIADPFAPGGNVHDAVEWRLHLKAPPGANGIRFRHVFFSEEYDDYVGSSFNDKFYAILEAGSTNGGKPTVINYTQCRNPQVYKDFVCSPGMQFCDPRQPYCYVAINTALSECCWLNGCPNGKATTDISGTGFECAASQSSDGPQAGSSTGWLMTEWPIEPGEDFYLTFHVHDTGDGVFDSEVILDGLQFVKDVTPGTWVIPPE